MSSRPEISTRHFVSLAIEAAPPRLIASSPIERRFIPITGGTVTGKLTGRILQGGGDWQSVNPDGSIEIDAHYVLDIPDHGLVEVTSKGVRAFPPNARGNASNDLGSEEIDPYFKTAIRLRTSSPDLDYINNRLFLSDGRRETAGIFLDLFEVV